MFYNLGKQPATRARGRGSRGGRTAAATKKPELNITVEYFVMKAYYNF